MGTRLGTTPVEVLNLSGALNLGSSNVTISTSVTAGAVTFGGTLSGSGSLTKTGPGVLNFTSTNSFIGTETVSAGTLNVSGGGLALNNGTLNISSGGTCTLNNTISAGGVVNNSGTFNVAPGDTFSSNGFLFTQATGSLIISGAMTADQFTFNGGNIAGQVQLNSSSSNTLNLSPSAGAGSFLFNGGRYTNLERQFRNSDQRRGDHPTFFRIAKSASEFGTPDQQRNARIGCRRQFVR